MKPNECVAVYCPVCTNSFRITFNPEWEGQTTAGQLAVVTYCPFCGHRERLDVQPAEDFPP